MAAEGKNKSEFLAKIAAQLSVKPESSEDLASKVQLLRDELNKSIVSGDTISGKLRGLVESLKEVIPDEKQRYHAALAAVSTTEKLSRQEIVAAVNNQLAELKILEKGLISSLPGWRDEIQVMESKAQGIRDEIANLREKIAQLESDEKVLLNVMAERKKEMEPVEKAVGEVFTAAGAEIVEVRKKIEEFTAERAAFPQPVPPAEAVFPSEKKEGAGQKAATGGPAPLPPSASAPTSKVPAQPQPAPSGEAVPPAVGTGGTETVEIPATPAKPEAEGQKKCPMCGGRMDYQLSEKKWMCYTCAYEEPGDATSDQSREKSPEAGEISVSSAPQLAEGQRKCPMCGGTMDYHLTEKKWMCYTCAYEEPDGGVQGESAGTSAFAAESEPARQPEPGFEPSEPFESPSAGQPSEEPPKRKKGLFSFKDRIVSKKKPCPSCGKKMNWHEMEKMWRCPYCEYERRI